MTDPISDMLIRLKNAQKAGKESVIFPYSKFKQDIVKVLENAGFLVAVEKKGKKVKKSLEVVLNPKNSSRIISGVKLISKPSLRIYAGFREVAKRKEKGGVLIVSTSRGVMSGREAHQAKLGGQLIAEIW